MKRSVAWSTSRGCFVAPGLRTGWDLRRLWAIRRVRHDVPRRIRPLRSPGRLPSARRGGRAGDSARPRNHPELTETWVAAHPIGIHDGPTMSRSQPFREGDSASRRSPRRPKHGRPPATHRGRHSRESRLRALQAALHQISSAWELSHSPLAKYRDLQSLSRTQFADRAFPEGWAVQEVLRLACTRVADALDPRKGEFLHRWVPGESIARIAASAGMSRSHLSRRWRPQVLEAIDVEIANLVRELRATDGRLEHEASESSHGSPPADGAVTTVDRGPGRGASSRATSSGAVRSGAQAPAPARHRRRLPRRPVRFRTRSGASTAQLCHVRPSSPARK